MEQYNIQSEGGGAASTADSEVRSRNWRTVECEEVEDEDGGGGGYSETEVEDDEEEGQEEVVQSNHRGHWTCDIFARDEPLRSGLHLQNTDISTPAPSSPAGPTALPQYTTNEVTTTLTPWIPHAPLPVLARSSSFEFSSKFYCLTCAAEFDLAEQECHLGSTDIWFCEICSVRMHSVARERHVDSETHGAKKRASKAPEREDAFCTVCQCAYPSGKQADHHAGLVHRTIEARTKLEAQCLAKSTPAPAGQTWYCDVCEMDVEWRRLASHLVAHCRTEGAPARGRPVVYQETVPPVETAKKKSKKGKAKKAKKTAAGLIYCNVCKKDENTEGIVEHLNSIAHQTRAANYNPTGRESTTSHQCPDGMVVGVLVRASEDTTLAAVVNSP